MSDSSESDKFKIRFLQNEQDIRRVVELIVALNMETWSASEASMCLSCSTIIPGVNFTKVSVVTQSMMSTI